jgi:hypothetical protein
MREIPAQGRTKKPRTTLADHPGRRRTFEWPLLIYPVLFLITLGILCLVNRSIEKELPTPVGSHPTAGQPVAAPDGAGHPDVTARAAAGKPRRYASGQARRSQTSTEAAAGYAPSDPAPRAGRVPSKPGRASSIAGKMQHAVDLSQLQGSARTAAMLRIAVDEKDHTRIKQCLADLVALGDEAVVPLNDLLANEEGETALWAATALARIGTPTATSALLDRLAETKEGPYKEELSKRIASISNHDSWPVLLDTMMQAGDTTVVRAAATSLSMMADAPVIDEVIARYDAASTDAEVERLTQLVRNIHSPKAAEPLLSLAGHVSAAPQDTLQEAAIELSPRLAMPVGHIAPPEAFAGEGTDFNAIDDSPMRSRLLAPRAIRKSRRYEDRRHLRPELPDEKIATPLERITPRRSRRC